MTAEQSPNWGSYSQATAYHGHQPVLWLSGFVVYHQIVSVECFILGYISIPSKMPVFFLDTQNLCGTSHHISSKQNNNHPGKY
jgi:hypothetical protein